MQSGDLNGAGPYSGLPSFYGGLFPLIWALVGWAGADPGSALAVVSWFEPAFWIAAAGFLGAALWPASRATQLMFSAFVVFGAGVGLNSTQQWVNAPNLAGQAFWPLYPRDVALILLLVAVAFALRGRWLAGGVVAAMAFATQAQVGLLTLFLAGIAVAMSERGRTGWTRACFCVAVGCIASAWWWLPRVVWTLRFGLQLQNNRVDLSLTPATILHAYGPLVILAAVGAVSWAMPADSVPIRFLRWWALFAALIIISAVIYPSGLLALRRALVLAALPLAAAAAEGAAVIGRRVSSRVRRAQLVQAVAALCVVGASVSLLVATHHRVAVHWANERYGMTIYSNRNWNTVWSGLRRHDGPVLAPPSDAAMAWFQTGRPELWIPRPGFLKVGFNVAAATGWSEAERQTEVESAFGDGKSALCRLAERRHADAVLLRSMPGLVGVIDMSGGGVVRAGLASPGSTIIDRNDVTVTRVPPAGRVSFASIDTTGVRALQVWQWNDPAQWSRLVLLDDGRPVRPERSVRDGATIRDEFTFPKGPVGSLMLVNRSERPATVVRLVAYEPGDAGTGPATVIPSRTFCG